MINNLLGGGVLIAAGLGAVGLWGQGGHSRSASGLPKNSFGHDAAPMISQPTPSWQSFSGTGGSGNPAGVSVQGYTRSNGTYVPSYHCSAPDHDFYNNWSTSPNVNPYTGSVGTRHSPSHSTGYGNSRAGHGGRGR